MKAATLKEIKAEISILHPMQIEELCMKMAKFRKENKEFLSYLLFDAWDEKSYINEIKIYMDEIFSDVNLNNLYLAKKTVRKIHRIANKYIKFTASKQTEVEVLIHFCKKLKQTQLPLTENTVLGNIYQRQLKNIKKTLMSMHEDLQFDYSNEINSL